MPYRSIYIVFFSISFVVILFACRKDAAENESIFYGHWKTSYGDTIRFYQENGKNLLYNDKSGSPAPPDDAIQEYLYENSSLKVKDLSPAATFRTLSSFTWTDKGRQFTVKGMDWFTFISSNVTVFTFTKID